MQDMLGIGTSRSVGCAVTAVVFWLLSAIPSTSAQDTTPPVLSVPFHTPDEMSSLAPYGLRLYGSGVFTPTYQVGLRSYRGSYPREKYPLRAVCAGVVIFVEHQAYSKDYGILTKPAADSIYELMYDHLVKPKVRKGDQFHAGALLGYFGNELQINRTDPTTHKAVAVCPRDLGTPAFNRVFDDLLPIGASCTRPSASPLMSSRRHACGARSPIPTHT